MCGISGGIRLANSKSQEFLYDFTSQAIKRMNHRGPDSNSMQIFDDGNLCFGHNRLKIIDLSIEAQQPMETDVSVIVFNGEIYNHIEIRNHLSGLGVTFRSNSDTEVLQKFLDLYGTSQLNMLNGMFAFAYFNKQEKSLTLVRDRFGVKPLYYQTKLGCMLFGSEMRIFSDSDFRKVNMGLVDIFIRDTAADFGSETIYQGLHQVKPGHLIRVYEGLVTEHCWYQPTSTNGSMNSYEFNLKFEDTLWNAIELRLACDVPVCLTLSGGLDSSTIYTLIKERSNQKITVFTYDHPGRKTSELARVKSLTDKYGDELIVVSDPSISNTSIKDILEDLEILEFPIWSFSSRAYRQMYQEIASRGFRVVIEGHGGDEILGGYQYMVEGLLLESLRNFRIPSALNTLKTISGLQGKVNIFNLETFRLLYQQLRLLVSRNLNRKITFYGERIEAVNIKILPIVLRAFDRLSMNYSLESRCPLLDFRVVELCLNAKNVFLMNSSGTKLPMRTILRKYGNLEIANFPEKQGFSSDLESMHQSRQLRIDLIAELDLAAHKFPKLYENFLDSRKILEIDQFEEATSYSASKNALLATFLSRKAMP
jgi:asparagine synthase (glutamine-hydrolysing)